MVHGHRKGGLHVWVSKAVGIGSTALATAP